MTDNDSHTQFRNSFRERLVGPNNPKVVYKYVHPIISQFYIR